MNLKNPLSSTNIFVCWYEDDKNEQKEISVKIKNNSEKTALSSF